MFTHPKNNILFTVCLAFSFMIATRFSFAGSVEEKRHFQFPHFFSESPDGDDRFVLRFSKGMMQFTNSGVSFQIIKANPTARGNDADNILMSSDAESENIRIDFLKSNPSCLLRGSDPLTSSSNYFLGSDRNKWKNDLQNYNSLLYKELYPDIDLKYYILNGEVKYDYIIQQEGNIESIKMNYTGVESLTVNGDGSLSIRTKFTELKDYMPKSYQVIDGKEIPVQVHYNLYDSFTVGFTVGEYNKKYPLIIDPALIYSTFVGGNDDEYEYTGGISLDAAGNIYVTGRTLSGTFPTTAGVTQPGWAGNLDAFIFKLNPTGTGLVFSTFIGGSSVDAGYTTKIDPVTNDIYMDGTTGSANFPTTAGAFQTAYGGGIYDPFCLKLNAAGNSLIYSTLLGNAQDDYGASLAIDNIGNAYIVGQSSGPYPTTPGAYQSAYAGGPWDLFVTKLNSTGSAVIFSTMIGGPNTDHSHSIQVDGNYDIFIGGNAQAGYPTTPGTYDQTYNGGLYDTYVTKLNSTGTALIYSTFVGGVGDDMSWNSLVIDNLGFAYMTGYSSGGFPTTGGAFQNTYGGGPYDVIAYKLDQSGSALLYSTYIGGNGDDEGWGITLNANNEAFITGLCSFGYPYTPCSYDTTFNGNFDAFITQLNSTGSSVLYSSYIGGANADQGYNIINVGNFVYVAGSSASFDFPYTTGAYDTTWNGLRDIVIFEMDISGSNTVTAGFNSATTICLNSPIQFNNQSLNATSYYWDFGDGTTSILQDPVHAFATSGSHDVRLIASATCAPPDTLDVTVTIVDPPVAAFADSSHCSLSVNFFDQSTGGNSYSWDFGDFNTSTATSPNHTYSIDGTYTVSLIVTNSSGCADTIQHQLTINPTVLSEFAFTAPQCTLQVSLQNSSTNATSYEWNFGDGSVSSVANPTYVYSDTGSYTIQLIANPGTTCADTSFQPIALHLPPVASFASQPGCNLTCDFSNTTNAANSYYWNFGDGSSSSTSSPSHTYSNDGNYNVTFIASNSFGCSDTVQNAIIINPVGIAAFAFNQPHCTASVSFQGTSLNASSHLWDFGDGNTSTSTSPAHTFPDTGSYTVTLIVNPNACPDTMVKTINVHPKPVAGFNFTPPVCALDVQLQNSSVNANNFRWDFSDGTTSYYFSSVHHFPASGTYTIRLIADPLDCPDTVIQQVTLNRAPDVDFSDTSDCSFMASFNNVSDSANFYAWDFGDGSTATATSPVHHYTASGTYDVTLIGLNNAGCTDTITRQVSVIVYSPADFTLLYDTCKMQAQFESLSLNASSSYWEFGDGVTSESINATHVYNIPSSYPVLYITNKGTACADTIEKTIEAPGEPDHGLYIPNCFTPNGDGINESFKVVDHGSCETYHLMIFNRWGEMIFQTEDLDTAWDGTFNGDYVPEDVYAWLLVSDDNQRQGSVTVLK